MDGAGIIIKLKSDFISLKVYWWGGDELLRGKLPGWKVGLNIDRYIRYGYLTQDDNEQLYLDWRTRAEVDQKALIDLLLGVETKS